MILPTDIVPLSPMSIEEREGRVRLSIGWRLLAYVLGMLTVVAIIWEDLL